MPPPQGGICERASVSSVPEEKRSAGITAHEKQSVALVTISFLFKRQLGSEASKTFAPKRNSSTLRKEFAAIVRSSSSIAQIGIGNEQPSSAHGHRSVVHTASSSELVARLALEFGHRALLYRQTSRAAKVFLCLATRSASSLSAGLSKVIVTLLAVEVCCRCLLADHVASAVQWTVGRWRRVARV